MALQYKLKIYEHRGFYELDAPQSLFPSKAIKENDDSVKRFLDEHYPLWKRVVVIFIYKNITQRHLIERFGD